MIISPATAADLHALAAMFHALWRDLTPEEHARDLAPLLDGKPPGTLPDVVLVAVDAEGRLAGFVDVGLRSHADGCDCSRPVGYLEGWYVEPEYRRRNVGALLVRAAEDWARGHGCVEMASDTWLDNIDSQRAHEALGFEVVDRCVNYRKHL